MTFTVKENTSPTTEIASSVPNAISLVFSSEVVGDSEVSVTKHLHTISTQKYTKGSSIIFSKRTKHTLFVYPFLPYMSIYRFHTQLFHQKIGITNVALHIF